MISFDTSAPGGWGGFDEILEELAAAVPKEAVPTEAGVVGPQG